MKATAEALEKERSRIEDVYRRREAEIEKDLYAPWQPAVNLMVAERKRVAVAMLHKLGKFPQRGENVLRSVADGWAGFPICFHGDWEKQIWDWD